MSQQYNQGNGIQLILDASFKQRIAYDNQARAQYIGVSRPGSATSSPVWSIRKLTYDGNSNVTQIDWANGTSDFWNIWDNYAQYSYS